MPVGALVETVRRFREDQKVPYANLVLDSEHGRQLITQLTVTFQTSRDAARIRLLKKGILTEGGARQTAELF